MSGELLFLWIYLSGAILTTGFALWKEVIAEEEDLTLARLGAGFFCFVLWWGYILINIIIWCGENGDKTLISFKKDDPEVDEEFNERIGVD